VEEGTQDGHVLPPDPRGGRRHQVYGGQRRGQTNFLQPSEQGGLRYVFWVMLHFYKIFKTLSQRRHDP
jgi:hypothetical protein